MQTLVLDTSGTFTTVLIVRNDDLAVASILNDRPAEHLHEQIQTSLEAVHIKPHDLDRIAVVTGPGSWTGLNIGVTAAKTMAQVLSTPLLPISTLDALVGSSPRPAWGIMHAGRNRCYYAQYTESDTQKMAVAPIELVLEQIRGDSGCVLEYGNTFQDRFQDQDSYHPVPRLLPDALITTMKTTRELEGDSIKALTPAYLQPSHVEQEAST